MTQPNQDLRFLVVNEDGTKNSKFPTGNKPVKRYIHLTGSGFGDAPTKAVYQDWRYEIVGQRAVKGVWDSGLYGGLDDNDYPLFGSLGGVVGICSRDNLNIDFNITVADSTDYKITISGVQYSINSGVGATSTSIVTALKSAINADSECPAVAGGTTYLSLTRKNPEIPYSVYGLTDTVSESPAAGKNIIERNNGLTGFIKQFTPSKSFFAAWQAGTPDEYYFAGSVSERTFPDASAQKMVWFSNGGLDSPAKADVVSLSRSSATTWSFVGNQSNVNIYNGSAYSWNKPNSFFAYHKAGTSPFVDAGVAISAIATDAGVTTASMTDEALFRKITTLTITAQNSADYIVTVNGTPCTTYTSDGNATTAEIQAGIIAAVNGSTSAVVASAVGSTVACKAANGTNPTVTATANLAVENLDPSFDQVSTIWQGNKNQANVNTIYPMLGVWLGDNCGNQVLLADSATFSTCTKFIALDTDLFSDTQIDAFYYDLQAVGMTHWIRLKDGVPAASGAL